MIYYVIAIFSEKAYKSNTYIQDKEIFNLLWHKFFDNKILAFFDLYICIFMPVLSSNCYSIFTENY